jgi:hypothetical protein
MPSAVIELLADGVVVFHAAVLAVYIAGAVSVVRGNFLRTQLQLWQRSYLAIVLIMAVTIVGGAARCPLTWLENAIRAAGDPASCYSVSFIEHYVPGLPTMMDQILSVALLTIGCMGVVCAALGEVTRSNSHREHRVHRVSDVIEPRRFDSRCPP